MSRFLLFLGLLLIPHFAHAQYLSPEDVLLRDGAWDGYEQPEEDAPPAEPVVTHPSPPAKEDPPMHQSPSPEEEPEAPTEEELDPMTERLLERLLRSNNNPQPQPAYEQPASEPLHSGALHAGADLTGSGPETVAAILVIMAAVLWTMWRGMRMKQWIKK